MTIGQLDNACCVTGHREVPAEKLEFVKRELRKEIAQAIKDGYTHFISGFAQGTDLLFASIVVDLMAEYPDLTLEAAIPYRKRLSTPDPLFQHLLGNCKIVGIHSEEYNPACYMKRNRIMVSNSKRVIVVYDGRQMGGTLYTMNYANMQHREVHLIQI